MHFGKTLAWIQLDKQINLKNFKDSNIRKPIAVEVEKQRQQQRLFTGKHRNNNNNNQNHQQKESEGNKTTWNNERWKL